MSSGKRCLRKYKVAAVKMQSSSLLPFLAQGGMKSREFFRVALESEKSSGNTLCLNA
jgi:hypothetical protein